MNSFYSEDELKELGLHTYGKKVLISKKVSIYSPEKIIIGNNVRIDDFCILSGEIVIGSNVHISAYNALYAKSGIELEDYTGISPRCTLLSESDDFSGDYLIGPTNLKIHTNVKSGKIILKKYSQLGTNTTVFPSVIIGEGTVTGAMTLVNKSLDAWGIYVGIPAKFKRNRSRELLKYLGV